MLMQDYEICHIIGSTCLRQLFHHVVSSIYSMRVGKDQAHFLDAPMSENISACGLLVHACLGELQKFRARISGGRYHNFGIGDACS